MTCNYHLDNLRHLCRQAFTGFCTTVCWHWRLLCRCSSSAIFLSFSPSFLKRSDSKFFVLRCHSWYILIPAFACLLTLQFLLLYFHFRKVSTPAVIFTDTYLQIAYFFFTIAYILASTFFVLHFNFWFALILMVACLVTAYFSALSLLCRCNSRCYLSFNRIFFRPSTLFWLVVIVVFFICIYQCFGYLLP